MQRILKHSIRVSAVAGAAVAAYCHSSASCEPKRDRGRSIGDIEKAPPAWDASAKAAKDYSRLHPNLVVVQSKAITALFTTLRDENTTHLDFQLAADRLMRMLVEEGMANLSTVHEKTVNTPCGQYTGLELPPAGSITAVSIVRAGDTLLESLRRIAPAITVGKILIQRDESTLSKAPKLFYVKLPGDIAKRQVILVDPMLATGQSAGLALSELEKRGVRPEQVLFLNVISCPEGLAYLAKRYPNVKVSFAILVSRLSSWAILLNGVSTRL